ncbi:hypothetical protein [Xenophilus sp.]|uniref:hypothetical protein n=1 Tax=Xenophilus sp. TaxID=1873499 RepID=UPI0037DC4FC1
MRTLAPTAVTALGARVLGLATLVHMAFPTAIRLASANFDIQAPSGLYRGAAGLGSISQIDDSPGEIKGLNFSLSGVPSEYIALALDDAAIVQGTPVTIRTAILDGETYALCDEPIVWQGRLDTMSIEEDGNTCTIAVTAESTAVDLLRGNPLTYSDADQQMLYPGDVAFGFIVSQINKPIVWPDKQWFQAKGA